MGSLSSLETSLKDAQDIEVECRTLDELVAEHFPTPDVLKIDVEGGGGEVIDGAAKTIEACRPTIYFELHAHREEAPELVALQRLRNEWNYTLTPLDARHCPVPSPSWGAAFWCEPRKL
jgi:hypothetical protein